MHEANLWLYKSVLKDTIKLASFSKDSLFIQRDIGITTHSVQNSYGLPLMTFPKPIKIPMSPPKSYINIMNSFMALAKFLGYSKYIIQCGKFNFGHSM